MNPYQQEQTIAIEAVQNASKIACFLQQQLTSQSIAQKKDGSLVTMADYYVQCLISKRIRETFPYDGILAEESLSDLQIGERELEQILLQLRIVLGESPAAMVQEIQKSDLSSSRYWALDPLDGTQGYIRLNQFCIALALLVEGEAVLGVLGCPRLTHAPGNEGTLLYAVRGRGAFQMPLNGGAAMPIAVRKAVQVKEMIRVASVEDSHGNPSWQERVAHRLQLAHPPLRVDSQVKYALLARGEASLYLRLPKESHRREWIWDHAAGAIVLEEAGGWVTDVQGRRLVFALSDERLANMGIVASHGAYHAEILEAVQQTRPE